MHAGSLRTGARIDRPATESVDGAPVDSAGCGQLGEFDRDYAAKFTEVGRQVSIGAQSGPVLPSFSSSLVNSGVGLTNGVPGAIGRDAQVACSAA